ncbi:MAG TPA: hypothetical protein VF916_02685 [Ktedonobacterales bacterium]
MTSCYDAGTLRAYLDQELPSAEMTAIADHATSCAACQSEIAELTALDQHAAQAFHSLAQTMPAADVALARLRPQLASAPSREARVPRVALLAPNRRPVLAGMASAIALAIVLAIPGARAAADQLLHIFRAQSVIYVSVSPSRIQQLQHLQLDRSALFLSKPTEIGTPAAPQAVSTAHQAAALVGFAPQTPSTFTSPPSSTSYAVLGQSAYQVQVNAQTLRQALATLGVTDVTIPDALGAQPITVSLPAAFRATYQGKDYTLALVEGTSPTVSLPAGVDLQQLGRAALEVYGMNSQQAATLSKQINWASTLVFPFPLGTRRIEQVNINGAQGVFLNASTSSTQQYLVYWQRGAHFYILAGQGDALAQSSILAIANSIR